MPGGAACGVAPCWLWSCMSMLGIDCEDWVADAGGAMSIPGIEAWSMPFIASSGLVGACGDGLRAGVGFPCRRSCFFTPGFFATAFRSEEHTSELQSLMRISYAVF